MSDLRKTKAGQAAFGGMLIALAMIFSYIESFIPINFGIPGIKLGLANLVVLTGLYYMRPAEILTISVSRILLTGFLFGSGLSIAYSLAGGLLSFLVMLLLFKRDSFSPIGVSAAGGAAHNAGQFLVASLLLRAPSLLSILPALLIAGTVTGILLGILSCFVISRLPSA